MSRIGKEPVTMPAGVSATIDGQKVTIKGKLGELSYVMHDGVAAKVEGDGDGGDERGADIMEKQEKQERRQCDAEQDA